MPSEKENAALRDILFHISAAQRFAYTVLRTTTSLA
jgi:hypothetical protein